MAIPAALPPEPPRTGPRACATGIYEVPRRLPFSVDCSQTPGTAVPAATETATGPSTLVVTRLRVPEQATLSSTSWVIATCGGPLWDLARAIGDDEVLDHEMVERLWFDGDAVPF